MFSGSNLIVTVAIGAVFVVLLLGLFNMARGGSPNLSQKLMRWRVGLQLLVLVLALVALYIRGH